LISSLVITRHYTAARIGLTNFLIERKIGNRYSRIAKVIINHVPFAKYAMAERREGEPDEVAIPLCPFCSRLVWSWSNGSRGAFTSLGDLAPTGKLRVALLPLPHIAVRDKDTGDFKGVVVDLSRELAKRLDVPVDSSRMALCHTNHSFLGR
jgi:ABC-type amino acid transport substrate-binding protein